jgi:hypothetical protein
MADADKNLNIQITTTADTGGVKQTDAALKDLQATTKTYSKAEVDALTKGTEEAKKATSAKQQMNAAVKGLSAAFPGLAAAARFALNPLTLSVAGLGVAFTVLREKMAAVGQVMSTSTWEPAKINAAAEAWERYAAAVKNTSDSTASLKADLNEIGAKFGLLEKLGADNPMAAKQRGYSEAYAQSKAALASRVKAAGLRRAAGEIGVGGSDEEDAATLATLDKEASAVAPNIAELDAEIAKIEEAFASPEGVRDFLTKTGDQLGLGMKYGLYSDFGEVQGQLKSQRAGYQGFVDRRDKFANQAKVRAAQRAARTNLLGKASELETQAAGFESGARDRQFDAQLNFSLAQRQAGNVVPITATGAGFGQTPEVAAEVRRLFAEVIAMNREFQEGMALFRAERARNLNRPE